MMPDDEVRDLYGYLTRKFGRKPTPSELAEEIRKTEEGRKNSFDPFSGLYGNPFDNKAIDELRRIWAMQVNRAQQQSAPREPAKPLEPQDKREFMADQSRGNNPRRHNYALNAQRAFIRKYLEAYPEEFYEALAKYELEERNLKIKKVNANYSDNPNHKTVLIPEEEKTKVPAAILTPWLEEHEELYPIQDVEFV